MDWCLVDLLLLHASRFLIDRIQIWTLRGNNVGGARSGVWAALDQRIIDYAPEVELEPSCAVAQWRQCLRACWQEGGNFNILLNEIIKQNAFKKY